MDYSKIQRSYLHKLEYLLACESDKTPTVILLHSKLIIHVTLGKGVIGFILFSSIYYDDFNHIIIQSRDLKSQAISIDIRSSCIFLTIFNKATYPIHNLMSSNLNTVPSLKFSVWN